MFIFLLTSQFLIAHPHLAITSRCTIHWDKDCICGIELEWDFDKYFSADIVQGYDLDSNGIFDEAELKEIYQFAFSNLEKYHYFTFFRKGSDRFTPEKVENFNAWYKDRVVTYSFFLPLDNFVGNTLHIAVYDYSFFCQVRYNEENPVSLYFDDTIVQPKYLISENNDYPVYYDPVAPSSDMTLHDKWHPGLKTFIPREIHIEF